MGPDMGLLKKRRKTKQDGVTVLVGGGYETNGGRVNEK